MGKRQRAQRYGTNHAASRLAPTPINLARARESFASGVAEFESGNPKSAAAALDDVLRILPTSSDALCVRGMIAAALDDSEVAVRCLRDGLRLRGGIPDGMTASAWNQLGVCERAQGELDSAETTLRTLVETIAEHGEGWHNLAVVLSDLARHGESVAASRKACALMPENVAALLQLAKQLRTQGRLNSSIAVLRRAVDIAPGDPDAVTSLGNALFFLGEVDEGLIYMHRACDLSPNAPVVWTNLATMLYSLVETDAALAAHERALSNGLDEVGFRFRRSAALLQKGLLREGWTEYEQRLDGDPPLRRWGGTPVWDGSSFDGQTLLVYREQGIGDELMFASCLPDVFDLAGTNGRVIIESDPRLVQLLSRSFPLAEVRANSDTGTAPKDVSPPVCDDADIAVAIGSLAHHLRNSLDKFRTAPNGYLFTSEELVARWSDRLSAIGSGPYVGISWRSMVRTAERRLEYSRLQEWESILTIPGIQFVLLQYDNCEREVFDAEQQFGIRIHQWRDLDLRNDFDNIAALMKNLDLVIAPRSAVTMLAGAIGAPTIAIGNEGDWSECGTTQLPWFTSVECINRNVRQPWKVVLNAAAQRIERLSRGEVAVDPPFIPVIHALRGA